MIERDLLARVMRALATDERLTTALEEPGAEERTPAAWFALGVESAVEQAAALLETALDAAGPDGTARFLRALRAATKAELARRSGTTGGADAREGSPGAAHSRAPGETAG